MWMGLKGIMTDNVSHVPFICGSASTRDGGASLCSISSCACATPWLKQNRVENSTASRSQSPAPGCDLKSMRPSSVAGVATALILREKVEWMEVTGHLGVFP